MRRLFVVLVVAAVGLLLSPHSANAGPIFINFTNLGLYGGISGMSAGPIVDQGFSFTFSSSGGTLTQGPDGIGVDGPTGADDSGEVGVGEQVNIFFPTTTLYSIDLRQLFTNELGFYVERGQYQVNGGAWTNFNALSTLGTLQLNFGTGLAGVSALGFRTPGGSFLGLLDDYSISGLSLESLSSGPLIDEVALPEPASMLLIGTGLAIGALRKYRGRRQPQAC